MTVAVNRPSGPRWRAEHPASAAVADLVEPFRGNVRAFVRALRTAGASVTIHNSYRPPQRVYLMHWAYRVANGHDPATVPPHAGIDIAWLHHGLDGAPDRAASRAAAAAMVAAYGIVYEPSLHTRHADGRAIDMDITWVGALTIVDAHGIAVRIAATPQTGCAAADRHQLHEVGASFGVLKLVGDLPHWSDDGR